MSDLQLAVLLFIYFFPAVVARWRGHQSTMAIFVLNLFLGWTVLGWVVALVWAASAKTQPVIIQMLGNNEARLLRYDEEERPQRSHWRWMEALDRKIFNTGE